ncbi:hypothetical protein PoB_006273400 [Plakobranchus ocellatus]|uniref:Uncharacterized protein n=1 Tax=Plakobranchus ocellatus TaxID=259542 RepID=A0AAV4CWE3_9GAST|nr:hypothetical protein PoB_006273400 [Plakobranchus ocellatus]
MAEVWTDYWLLSSMYWPHEGCYRLCIGSTRATTVCKLPSPPPPLGGLLSPMKRLHEGFYHLCIGSTRAKFTGHARATNAMFTGHTRATNAIITGHTRTVTPCSLATRGL